MIEDIIRSILGLPPGTAKINADLAMMRTILQPSAAQLIPWEEEKELELMSLHHTLKSQNKGLDKIQYGTLQSIYYEPMVAFAYKDYVKGSREALLYCRTAQMEFVYRMKKKDTDVFFNGRHVAVMDLHSVMAGLRSRQVIGAIRPYSPDLLSVVVQGKDAGHVFNPLRPHSDPQRAFFILHNMDEEEENIFLALGLYEIVTRLMANKKKK